MTDPDALSRSTPTFSVVIPLYNKRDLVRATLGTVLAQRLPPLEVVVVDDGSTDDSVAAINDLLHAPVRLVSQANAGPGPARNTGVHAARGDWIAFVDADDRWHPDHLSNLANVIAAFPDVSMVCAATRWQSAHAVDLTLPVGDRQPVRLDYFGEATYDSVHVSGSAIRREAFLATDGFGAFIPGEEMEFIARFALDNSIARSPIPTAVYVRDNLGIMDGDRRQFDTQLKHSPLDDLIALTLSDDRYRDRHRDISGYHDRVMLTAALNMLYVGNSKGASAALSSLHHPNSIQSRIYFILSLMPRPLLATAAQLYSKLKLRFTS